MVTKGKWKIIKLIRRDNGKENQAIRYFFGILIQFAMSQKQERDSKLL